ncbi:Ankyrin-2 (ANK-2) (Ankyrin-B) (Brain ankyrin), partial [Durusdinium trenchii]
LFVASLGYLVFGFGTTLLNTVGILAAVRVAPAQHSGKVAAAVLCSAALGMSFHTAVHAKWCWGAPFRFINYQILYSLFCAVLGLVMFRSRAWTVCLAEVEPQEPSILVTGKLSRNQCAGRSDGQTFQGSLRDQDFPWLAAIYLVPIAFCFAWLGNWTVYANSLGLSEQAKTRIGLSVGFFSAAGRLIFGILGDWTPKGRGLGLQSFGFGGVLCLAAVALRASFSGEGGGSGLMLKANATPKPAPAKPVKSKEAAPPSSYYSDSRTDVYSSESEGTPRDRPNLLQAAKAGDLQQVSSILKGKVEVSSLTAALHGACSEGHRKLLPVLCRAKANVNGLDSSGLTPLHVAAFRGDNPVVQQLCQLGANVKAVDEEGWTPLYVVAAFGGQEDVFKTLLTAKSDVNFTTPDGTTIAMAAEQKGFTQLLKLL